jgi:molecular chaperone HtpG
MKIPTQFLHNDLLQTHPNYEEAISDVVDRFSQILDENQLFFFEEYTDHGIKHIESVLQTAANMIPPLTCQNFIDAKNSTALILAIVLHDIGMHLSFSSFKFLVENDQEILIPELDKLTWKQLWENYTEEAKKFSIHQKIEIFGRADLEVEIPRLNNKDDLNGYQKKLIGEFIRRNHARIAHEIAVSGLRTPTSIIPFAERLDYLRDLIGLIARSHGMELRSLYDYVELKYEGLTRNPHGIHIWFLMIVLRISDYFQIDRQRLRIESLKLKTFNSPISLQEHQKHFCIVDLREKDLDPETLIVFAKPQSNHIFWSLIELLKDIQNELDVSWAVLGEKHGKEETKPKIKFRRIISNIQNVEKYSTEVNFIPERVLFDADADLPKLLVEPLYGDDPSFGVRELLQNAIDACYARLHIDSTRVSITDLKIDITIQHLNESEFVFEICDNGKGMDVKEIKNYFLKAGATNRKSKDWNQLYVDESGQSKIIKSGKFGVGILSAFLIGEEIEVTTRKFNAGSGIKFSTTLNSKNVELFKIKDLEIGTKIRIKIKDSAIDKFINSKSLIDWDKWYTLSHPKINYRSSLHPVNLGYKKFDPDYTEESNSWKNVMLKEYAKIRWSYSGDVIKGMDQSAYKLTCNGLIIPIPPIFESVCLRPPHIQVFDFNGLLPVNLGRNSLDTKYLPFEDELKDSIFLEILLSIFEQEVSCIVSHKSIEIKHNNKPPEIQNIVSLDYFFDGFLYSKNGMIINNNYVLDFFYEEKFIDLLCYSNEEDSSSFSIDIKNSWLKVNTITRNYKPLGNINVLNLSNKLEFGILKKDSILIDLLKAKGFILSKMEIASNELVLLATSEDFKKNIFIGNLTQQEYANVVSLYLYASCNALKQSINQKEFGDFLRRFFKSKENCILPQDREARIKRYWYLRDLFLISLP